MARIAINGIGRIGKLVLRAFMEEGTPGEVVLLNDPVGDPAQHAHLLEFDTVHGRWLAEFAHDAVGGGIHRISSLRLKPLHFTLELRRSARGNGQRK